MSRRLVGLAALLLALLAAPSGARAEFGLVPGSVQVATLDAAGQPELRAGAHPDRMLAGFAFNTVDDGGADGNVKDLAIDLPAGFTGDGNAVPVCSRTDFQQRRCGAESQVGIMHVSFAGILPASFPIYTVAPHEGELAELGFLAVIVPVRLVVSVRSDGDYGSELTIHDLPQNLPLTAVEIELWGVPADRQSGTALPRRPFLTNPTSCDGDTPVTTVRVRSWQAPEQWVVADAPMGGPLVGCERLAFDPALGLALDTPSADTPSGLSVDLTLPRAADPDGLAISHTRDVAITFPGGLTLSPGVADGLSACDDERLGIGTSDPPSCPASSKIGTVELTTLLLEEPLKGGIYLGRAVAGDRFRLFLTASGRGVVLKLTASLQPDPETGQLLMLLPGLPELPFDRIELHFKDGPRAQVGPVDLGTVVIHAALRLDPDDAHLTVATDPLPRILAGVPLRLRTFAIDIDRRGFMVNPTSCRPTRVTATLSSIDEATSHASSRYALGRCGTLPFSPAVSLSLTSPAQLRRGGHPGLAIALHEPQRQAALRSAKIELPSAVSIDPAAVTTICTRERAGAGRCPRGSAVGSARARSPLLPQPLTGSIDVVQPSHGTQPDLWAALAGNGVRLNVRGTTSAPSGGPVVADFAGLPDIPLSGLRLSLRGGRRGLLSLKTGLCGKERARLIAVRVELRGHNDKRRSTRVRVHAAPPCSRGAHEVAPGGTTLATHMVEPAWPPPPAAAARRQAPTHGASSG